MELEYVLRAVRRFWPIVYGSVLLGIIAALFLAPSAELKYESSALVLVRPIGEDGIGDSGGDRYIASEIVVMEAPSMALDAADAAGLTLTPREMARTVSFSQVTGTDVVRITAEAETPETAQAIANGYLDAYVRDAVSTLGETVIDDREELEQSISTVEQQLADVTALINQILDPLKAAAGPDGDIPSIESIAPDLATQREVVIDKYRELLRQRLAIGTAGLELTSQDLVIQRADLPTTPTSESTRLTAVGIGLAVSLFGIVTATVLARLSRRVLDAREVAEVLDVPFAAELPRDRALREHGLDSIGRLPRDVQQVVNALSVQAEALGAGGASLSILVVGSTRGAGTSTLATAIAARFGERGSRVALVDLDFERLTISRHFGVNSDGFSVLLAHIRRLEESRQEGDAPPMLGSPLDGAVSGADRYTDGRREVNGTVFTTTKLRNVSLLGRPYGRDQMRPQRFDLEVVLDTLGRFANVVVMDGGPMLDESAAAVLASRSDAIVLTVPVKRQQRSPLAAVARHLRPMRSKLLLVEAPDVRVYGHRPRPASTEPSTARPAAEHKTPDKAATGS